MSNETDEIRAHALAGDLPAAVCSYVKEYDHVSFVEIGRTLEPYLTVKGDHCLFLPDHENLILWVGMSKEWVTLMIQLLAEHRLYLHSANPLVYLIDGGIPRLPIAKSVRQYKKEHWLPVTFRVIPPALPRKKGEKVVP